MFLATQWREAVRVEWFIFVIPAALFLGLLVCLEIGFRLGRWRRAKKGTDTTQAGTGVTDAAVFGLLGLVVAFTFGGAASRLDQRRQLLVEEANAIGTAYLRLDLLPAEIRPEVRELFREYLDARIRVYQAIPDLDAAWREWEKATELQGIIWNRTQEATRASQWPPAAMLLLPAVNQMIDLTTERTFAAFTHVPMAIVYLMCVIALLSAVLAGHTMTVRDWLHMVLFALVVAVSVYVILDLEYPRLGLIRLDAADQVLVQLRQSMR